MGLGDKYVLEVPIGESETGTVWAAKDVAGGRRVVIAILEEDAPDALKERFEAQAKALCEVHHPNVVRALESGRNEDGAPYLVMERLDGVSLAKRWATAPPLRADRTLEIGIGVIDGLAKVHEATLANGEKLIHGDVEPGNVILVGAPGKEVAKLIGFGLNRATTRLGSPGSRASLATLEPFAFAAPEQARGEVDASVTADLYSAAALIFAGLTGRPPHVAENAGALADAVAKQAAPAFISLRKDLAPFAATLDRALASDPHKRYADGHALARALRTSLAMGRIVGSKETPVGPRVALGPSAATTASSAGGTSSPKTAPPPSKLASSGAKPPEVKAPEATAKPSEASAKPSETAPKPSEASAKPSEAAAKPSEADGKPTEPTAKAPDVDGAPTEPVSTSSSDGAPTEPVHAAAAKAATSEAASERVSAIPSGELELASGELTLEAPSAPKSVRPPPPPAAGTSSIFEVDSGIVELEANAPAKPASVRPPPPPSPSGRPPPKPVHGWMPAPEPPHAPSGDAAEPSAAKPTEAPTHAATAAAPATEAAAVPSALDGLPGGADANAPPMIPLTAIEDEPIALPAANGPPLWLVGALAVTVLSLGGIYAWMRFGQVEPAPHTESLGTILADTPTPPATTAPAELPPIAAPPPVAPPPVAPPPVEPPPVAAPPVAPPVVAPPVVAPQLATPPQATGTRPAGTTGARATGTGASTGARATGTATGTRATGTRTTGARATGTRATTSGTSMATTSMATGMGPTGSGRTTVVTDPGF